MISLQDCILHCDLHPDEIILGVRLSDRHSRLLASYLYCLGKGPAKVREMILADLRRFLDLGARDHAADLLIVLRRFLREHPAIPDVSFPQGVLTSPANSEAS